MVYYTSAGTFFWCAVMKAKLIFEKPTFVSTWLLMHKLRVASHHTFIKFHTCFSSYRFYIGLHVKINVHLSLVKLKIKLSREVINLYVITETDRWQNDLWPILNCRHNRAGVKLWLRSFWWPIIIYTPIIVTFAKRYFICHK